MGFFAVVAAPRAAPFQRQHIKAGGVILFIELDAVAPAQSRPDGKRLRIARTDRCAEMQMLQKALRADAQEIGGRFILQVEYAAILCDHRTS